ncbi:hypothetical protein [Priestia megaterium]|uniref:hypothetical protein n=1 Tax=Priestia megaterium TaxID=1404 RepID=UPI0028779834|nr:hypothetical protein [Priestia megaterium]
MNNKRMGGYIGSLKSENKYLKAEIEELKFEVAMLKNHNRQLFEQVYGKENEINLNGRGTITVRRG